MTKLKYFADVAGEAFELSDIIHEGPNFYGASNFTGIAPNGERIRATRCVKMKSNPSKHVCDSRCLYATGRVLRCECSCGGKNHGKGHSLAYAG